MIKLLNLSCAALLLLCQMSMAAPPNVTATSDDFISAATSATSLRLIYTEAFQTNAMPPSSFEELGYPEFQLTTDEISHVNIDPFSNAILIGLTPKFGQNEWIAFIPNIVNYSITEWACQTTLGSEFVANTGCKGNIPYDLFTQVVDQRLFLEILVNTAVLRTNYQEHFQTTGQRPRSNNEIGASAAWIAGSNADHVIIESKHNEILLGLNQLFGVNQWLSLTPNIRPDGYMSWSCSTTLNSEVAGLGGRYCRIDLDTSELIR